jgi:uncharacterized protein (TIGR02594 family)
VNTPHTPSWLHVARTRIGERETLGPNDSPYIRRILARLHGSWLRGQPWCGAFVAEVCAESGLAYPRAWYRARAWLDWGVRLAGPALGCVVVFQRPGGGHVGLVVGIDAQHRLMVLGGNQGDAVNIRPFDQSRVLGYRWPAEASRDRGELPLLASTGPASRNEA